MALKRNILLTVAVFIVFIGSLVGYLHRVPQRHYCDYRVYYKAGQDFIQGKNIYFRETEDVTPFKYSPFFAFVFVPLALLPIKASATVFFTINFLSTILFLWLAFHLVRRSSIAASFSEKQCFLIYILAILFSARYVLLVLDSGQVTILMGLLILLGLMSLSKGKDMPAGAFFAGAILIKYTPVLFLFYFLLRGRFKVFLWSLFFTVVFLILPALIVGINKEILYLSSWIPSIISTSLDKFSYMDSKNQSIFSIFVRFLSPTYFNVQFLSLSFEQALGIGRLVALLVYAVIFIRGKAGQAEELIDFALLMICVCLFNPNGWLLNFVLLLFPFMVLIQYMIAVRSKDWFVLFSVIVPFIILNIMSKDILGKAAENFGCAYSFTAFGALILFVALLKLKFFPQQPNSRRSNA